MKPHMAHDIGRGFVFAVFEGAVGLKKQSAERDRVFLWAVPVRLST